MTAKTLFEKVWDAHVIRREDDGGCLLYIDRHLLHEGSRFSFEGLRREKRKVRNPAQTFGFADHYVPTDSESRSKGARGIDNPEIRYMVEQIEANCANSNIRLFGLDDPNQGIVHVVAPEQGIVQPGMTIVCGDSHTSTHGAFGALSFGIGASEVMHVMATQTLWQKTPKRMRITVDGEPGTAVTAKDIALGVIAAIGASGGSGHAIEYAGSAISALPMAGRMTVCNLTIEAGARFGMIAPDETTLSFVAATPSAPKGETWDQAAAYWLSLSTDDGAHFDREVRLDASALAPMVTWGTSPQDAIPITADIPGPSDASDDADRARIKRALEYMGLDAGTPISGVAIDRVFIGSCTNSRISDLRAAAAIAKGRRAKVSAMVVPGSKHVQVQAEQEGLADIFRAAGFQWREPGCSMCLGTNGDTLAPHERCASTSNRNFEGRQGRLGRTHLMSPAMAAAAAVTGRITDVRTLLVCPEEL